MSHKAGAREYKTHQSAVMKSSDWTARSAMTYEGTVSALATTKGASELPTHLLVRPRIAHHTHCLHGQQHGEGLANLVVQTSFTDFLDVDVVRLLEDLDLVARDRSKDTNGQTRAREGMTLNEVIGNREKAPERTNFVFRRYRVSSVDVNQNVKLTFEELTQRLNELELHVLEQTTDVVVRLNCCTWALEADALNDIGIECALKEPLDLALGLASTRFLLCGSRFNLRCLRLKHMNERVSDDFSLLLRIFNTLKAGEEEVGSVDDGEVHSKIFVEHLVYLLRFIQTKHPVVDHDSVETNSMMSENCSASEVA